MSINVLVVGGAGYIGGWLTDELMAAGHAVRVYDSLVYEERFLKPVEFALGDVRDARRLQPHLDWADVVVWLAALVGDGACALNPQLTEEINLGTVRHLVRSFDRRVVFMSTCSVYGAQDGILDEQAPVSPLSLYAKTKLEAERIISEAGGVSFRLGTIFGLGDTYSRIRLDLVVNLLTMKACMFQRISVYGGDQYRPMLHVRDVSQAVVKNLGSPHEGVFNLCYENARIVDVASAVARHVPGVRVEVTELKFQDARNYQVTDQKARDAFGFSPTRSMDEGILEIKALVEDGRIRDVCAARYSNADFLRPLLMDNSSPLGREIPTFLRND
ncbi:MAG: NAD(P)-dependent oxidoreductase [Pseudomonadota bacterium]